MYNERPEYAGIGYCWIIVCPDDAAKARVLKDFSKVTFEGHFRKEIWRCDIGPTHLRKFLLASCESHLSEIERVLVVKVFFRKRWAVSAVNGRSETHDVIDPRFVVVMTTRLHHDRVSVVCMFGDVVWLQTAGIFGLRGRSTVRAVRWRDRRALSHSYRENASADWLRIT